MADNVFSTGYSVLLCRNISSAWQLCDQGNEQVESELVPDYEECEPGDVNCQSRNDASEVQCRKDLLDYYSRMYQNQKVYETIRDLDSARDDLVTLCRNDSLSNTEVLAFPISSDNDELLVEAISEIEETCVTVGEERGCPWELDISLSLLGEVT